MIWIFWAMNKLISEVNYFKIKGLKFLCTENRVEKYQNTIGDENLSLFL